MAQRQQNGGGCTAVARKKEDTAGRVRGVSYSLACLLMLLDSCFHPQHLEAAHTAVRVFRTAYNVFKYLLVDMEIDE